MGLMERTDIRTSVPTIHGDWIKKHGETWRAQVEALKAKFGSDIQEVRWPGDAPIDVPIVFVNRSKVVEILKYLKEDPAQGYNFLADLTAIDEQPASPRFEVVYNLLNQTKFCRIRIKCRVDENQDVPTIIELWKGANWAEREVYDMFGIKFSGHPDLRRILLDERWVGHPLRKDYPLRGYQCFSTPEPIHPDLLK